MTTTMPPVPADLGVIEITQAAREMCERMTAELYIRPTHDPNRPIGSDSNGVPGWIVGLLHTFMGDVQAVATHFASADHWSAPQTVQSVATALQLDACEAAAACATLQIYGLLKRTRGVKKKQTQDDSRLRQRFACTGSFRVQCAVQALLDQHRADDHKLHLEVLVDRLKREFGVEANVGKPQVAYKETIQKEARAEGR